MTVSQDEDKTLSPEIEPDDAEDTETIYLDPTIDDGVDDSEMDYVLPE